MEKAAGRKAARNGCLILGTVIAFCSLSGCTAFRIQTKVVEKPVNVMVRTLEEKSMKVQYMDKATGELRAGIYRVPAGSWIVSDDYVSASEEGGKAVQGSENDASDGIQERE